MKNKKYLVIEKVLYTILAVVLLTGCRYGDKYDKLILTDLNTGKQYFMKHNFCDTYMINEKVIKISGKDTISVLE